MEGIISVEFIVGVGYICFREFWELLGVRCCYLVLLVEIEGREFCLKFFSYLVAGLRLGFDIWFYFRFVGVFYGNRELSEFSVFVL